MAVAPFALAGAVFTLMTLLLLQTYLPQSFNFAGKKIPTAAGVTAIPIILITLMFGLTGVFELSTGGHVFLIYVILAAAVGFADDLWGGEGPKGFKGHLGALVRGRITTGMVKVFVLGAGALVVGAVLWGMGVVALLAAIILAGSVNLANLLDVRPGRTLKFMGIASLILLFGAPYGAVFAVAGILGGAIALFYFDLKGRIMLGDAGAAIFGAVPGYLVVAEGPDIAWWIAAAVILGLTALAEVSSISRWIEEVGALRWFDEWGRGR
jgi:hypothetical protein